LLDQAGHSRRGASGRQQRRRIVDQVAAVLILKSFLDARDCGRAELKPTAN
jgi:RNase H-fold protein (predicted Holliday junction resolvase)